MPTYVVGLNILAFVAAFWTAVVYGIWTRDWVGTALWLSLGFACLTADRLIPHRRDGEEGQT